MKKKTIFIILICISFFACNKEETVDIEDSLTIDTSSYFYGIMEKYDIDESRVQVTEDYYIVDNDIIFSKNKYPDLLKSSVLSGGIINNDNQEDITIYIDSSIPSGSEWRDAISDAVSNWNAISDCRLNFSITTQSSADIVVKDDTNGTLLDDLVVGDDYPFNYPVATAGSFPANGEPGDEILINLDVEQSSFGSLSLSQKIYNVSHAIGHCVGFIHTDWSELEWSEYKSTAVSIPGTVFTGANLDEYSIMNYQDLTRTWSFSSEDIVAIQYLYKGKRVHIKSGDYYISVSNGVVSTMNGTPGEDETFIQMEATYQSSGDPYYNFQIYDGEHYLQVNSSGEFEATSVYAYNWQKFGVFSYYSGVTIRSYDNLYFSMSYTGELSAATSQPSVFYIVDSNY